MKEQMYKIVMVNSGVAICWWGKNGSGKYGPKADAEKAAKQMNANSKGSEVVAIPKNSKWLYAVPINEENKQ
jgi:hypothetical protein